MGGFLLFNGPFSRITFGLFEDSGYIIVISAILALIICYNIYSYNVVSYKFKILADGIILIMSLHKSLPGEETEAALSLMEAVHSISRISKQGI